jgi:hypothetical protein
MQDQDEIMEYASLSKMQEEGDGDGDGDGDKDKAQHTTHRRMPNVTCNISCIAYNI